MKNILSEKTLVTVATYNPQIPLLAKNLQALVSQFEHILVVDDGSKNVDQIINLVQKLDKASFKPLSENKGIACLLNIGLKQALSQKFEWLLTMDQDSVIPDNFSQEYLRIINKFDNIGLVCWRQEPHKSEIKRENVKDWQIISSGCLNNVKAIKKCGGFDEKLVIDHVDTDINVRIQNAGYLAITTNNVKLVHEIGKATKQKTIRGAIYHEHSPLRVYYIVRNGIVLFKRYFFRQPVWMLRAIKNSIREGVYLLKFQPNKLKNLTIICRAWFDGIFNKLGKYQKNDKKPTNK